MDQGLPVESPTYKTYAISGKIMLASIVILFAVVVFMVGFHLYARWYVLRRSRQRTRTVIYVDNHNLRSVADRGLEPSVLNSLPLFVYATAKAAEQPSLPLPAECAVCLSEFGASEVVRLLPKCRHTFHVDCIGMWFHSHSTCPLCRSTVEAVVNLAEEERNGSGSQPSSSLENVREICATCQHEEGNSNTTSLWGRRKSIGGGILGIRIETPPAAAAESELTQSSPGGRLLSLKRIFSMSRKTPTGSSGAAGTSGAAELDLEDGLSEPVRVQTPR